MVVVAVIKVVAAMMTEAVVIMVLVAVSVVAAMSTLVAAMTDGELLIKKQLVSLKWPSWPSSSSHSTSPCRPSVLPWPARRFPEINN